MSNPDRTSTPLNRRQFLGDSARNAATAAAGVVGLSHISQSRASAYSGDISKANTVRVGIIGLRNQGLELARVFQHTSGCEISAICDVDSAVRARAGRELNLESSKVRSEEDANFLFDDPNLDALVIATPDHHHAWMSAMAANAGKHLYLEIPTTHKVEEGERLQQMLSQTGVLVQVGLQHRSGQHYRSAMEYLHSEELGSTRYVKAWACVKRQKLISTEKTIPHPLSQHQQKLWLGPESSCELAGPDWHFQWRCLWPFGSGELGSWGVPLLDIARWGLQADMPNRVTATGGSYHLNDGRDTPDTLHVQYDFPEAAIVWEHRQWTSRGHEGRPHGVAFYGEKGTLIIDRSGWKVYDSKKSVGQPASKTLEPHVQNFIDAIRQKAPLAADFTTGRISSDFCHLGNRAFQSGEPISVNA
ncbi:Gfo/Idh/MocA family oxidoreductase [Rubinisphaera sp.]|uniref:Gfo/Idh/MocA family protein n=1 Tax=Rubinisphaera sp. TaxID=2024857 RepID=UPI000C0CF14E|nr:Gfo/Idh/MocA family oxidoreductase [Rubinisphaera sp.]MBV07944.1 dehydrogenase [Rubinisphaera sp.]|tara:strand:- start:5954 stop:7204 length:1251 start_codon:yes stop_codon:yes gene_type:complete